MRVVVVSADPEVSAFAAACIPADGTVVLGVARARSLLLHPVHARCDVVVVAIDGPDTVELVDELALVRPDVPVVAWGERRLARDRGGVAAATLPPPGRPLGPEAASSLLGAIEAARGDRVVLDSVRP